MKKILIIISITTFSVSLMAQGTVMTKYFNELSSNDAYTKLSVSRKMFSLFTELEAGGEAEKEFVNAVSKLKGLKIIVGDSVPGDAAKMYSKVLSDVKSAGYEELMSVKDAEENMYFSIKENGGKIEELLMVIGGKRRFVLLSLYGEIDLKSISKIARVMKVDGLEHLSKVNDGN